MGKFDVKVQLGILWGKDRHMLIGHLADSRLTDEANGAIQTILQPINQKSLGEIAVWADTIRNLNPDSVRDEETKNFLKVFPKTGPWHYVNLPLGAESYSRQQYPDFTSDEDVVQKTILAIEILSGKSKVFSKANALRWLVHLLGDIHQPLHVGTAYIEETPTGGTIFKDPAAILERKLLKKSDQGGNLIYLPNSRKLHEYWDTILPAMDMDNDFHYIEQPPVGKDDLIGLPAQWASETLRKSSVSYESLKIVNKLYDQKGKFKGYEVTWDSEKEYNKRSLKIIKEQKELAASRLAFVLNTIYQ